ncbi:MAG: HAMP domain-containing histidine kinase [Chromatiales bacterium]|nr:HAMP domain-containing histidine kinase [Chromatiales bacterium]
MRLNRSIFLWVFPAAVVPLAALALIATTWSEQRYFEGVDRDLFANVASVMGGLERRLLVERDILDGLTRVPPVQQFKAVLEELNQGRQHGQTYRRYEQVARFFETFQSVRTSLDTVRILDREGHTLVKVEGGARRPASFGGLGALPYVEREPQDPRFAKMLASLASREIGSVLLDHDATEWPEDRPMPVFSTAATLVMNDAPVGYLTIDAPLGPLNRIVGVAPRLHHGSLLIAELNIGNPERDGLVLYDDDRGADFSSVRSSAPRLQEQYPAVYSGTYAQSYGVVDTPDGKMRIYFQEFLPYPDRLVSWVVATRIRTEDLRAPFRNIRIGIFVSVLATLLFSLLLARAAAARIAQPVVRLAQGLAAFAGGDRSQRVEASGPDEIRDAGRAFNAMADSLDRAEHERDEARAAQERSGRLASLGQMAAGIAHEISNPINTIISLTTLIQRELPGDADGVRADVQSIREESERAAQTIRAILNFSSEIGGEKLSFDAAEWVRDTVALAAKECHACGVEVDLTVDCACTLVGDRRLLQRALRNLLENAAQASPFGEHIQVSIGRDGDMARIEVLDNGPGLNAEQADRAFDPFFTTKPQGEGSGLGLSISLGIVQFHGGTLDLRNRPDGGAVARMLLPLGNVTAAQADAAPDSDTSEQREA